MGRQIKARVHCYSGFSGCDYPLAVDLDGVNQSVMIISAEWRTPFAKHYLVQLENGCKAECKYSLIDLDWQVKIIHQRVKLNERSK